MDKQNIALKVSSISGRRIIMTTERKGRSILLTVPYLAEVEKDNPDFAKEGVISIEVAQGIYTKTKDSVTKYLEDLFLKELAGDNTSSSNGSTSNPGGAPEKPSKGSNGTDSGKAGSSLRDSGGRGEQSESDRAGDKETVVAESNDKDSIPVSKKRT